MDADRVRSEARKLVEPGFRVIRVRLGYEGTRADVETVRAIHKAVPDDIPLMSHQSLAVSEAVPYALDGEGLRCIEDPT